MTAFQKRACFPLLTLALSVAPASFAGDKEAKTPGEMVTRGSFGLDFRYRYEHVDQDGFDEDANANTLRSRLTLSSAAYKGLSLLGEVDNVAYIGNDDFNSGENGEMDFPIVADPKGTAVNQLWLKYAHQELSGTGGRQRIIHDNARFVGNVGWRQNEQTYDGLRLQWQGAHGLSLEGAYVYRVKRIFGPDDGAFQPADLEGDNYFVRGHWQASGDHGVTAFAYILDIDDDEKYAPGKSVDSSTQTYGLMYAGKLGPVNARAAYARQSDTGDSGLDYDTDYYMVEADAELFPSIDARLGYEVLATDNNVGFKTPYATLHKFQGWADLFLVTPAQGIEDLYAGLAITLDPVKFEALYHDFDAEGAGGGLGSEIDLAATWSVNKMWMLQLKYADYSTGNKALYADTEKFWATVQFKY